MDAQTLMSLLAGSRCVACRARARPQDLLCPQCRCSLPWLEGARCMRCGLPLPCAPAGRPCPAAGHRYSVSWAPLAYDGAVPALVQALKERGALPVADLMAATIAARVPRVLLGGARVVPVPADPWRSRRRGVDHAALIASGIGVRCGLPVLPLLVRRRAARHAGAGRDQRLARAAAVAVTGDCPAAPVLLVDDVHTTGATLAAAAAALSDAGAPVVRAVTFARTL